MQNQEILEIIENLKGRRSYEEKKASKLGFSSLYAYFEDKIYKKKSTRRRAKRAEQIKTEKNLDKKSKNKSCSCC